MMEFLRLAFYMFDGYVENDYERQKLCAREDTEMFAWMCILIYIGILQCVYFVKGKRAK